MYKNRHWPRPGQPPNYIYDMTVDGRAIYFAAIVVARALELVLTVLVALDSLPSSSTSTCTVHAHMYMYMYDGPP